MSEARPMTRLEMARRELEPGERLRLIAALREGVPVPALVKRFSWSQARVLRLAKAEGIELQIGGGQRL